MALTLLQRSYGATNAGNRVLIRDTITSQPARLYATQNGGVLSQDGSYTLPASGDLALWVDDSKQYTIDLATQTGKEVSVEHGVDAGSVTIRPSALALATALPAAANAGASALVGTVAPYTKYTSDGLRWVPDTSPIVSYHAGGTVASPVSTTVCVSTQGLLATPTPLLIPANTLSVGSKVTVQIKVRRTGNAQSDILYVRLGTSGGSADPIMANSTFTTVSNPVDGLFAVDIDVTAPTTVLASYFRNLLNIGVSGAFAELTSANIALGSDMFVSFGYTTTTPSADAFVILGYDVAAFKVTQ